MPLSCPSRLVKMVLHTNFLLTLGFSGMSMTDAISRKEKYVMLILLLGKTSTNLPDC